MKFAKAFLLLVLAFSLCCGGCLAANGISWESYINIPTRTQQTSYKSGEIAPYISIYPDFGSADKFIEYAVDFRAEHLPRGTYLAVGNWDMGSKQLSRNYKSVTHDYGGVGGYCGFQVWGDGTHAAILTLWDTYLTDSSGRKTTITARQIYPENNKYGEYVKGDLTHGEGCFYHCLVPFDWEENHDYRALIQIANSYKGDSARLLFYVCDLETERWTRLMEFELGYDEAYMSIMCSFLENYIPAYSGELRSMVMSNYRAHSYGGSWVSAKRAKIGLGYSHPGSYNFGASGDKFWVITSAIPNLCKNPRDGYYTVSRADASQPY